MSAQWTWETTTPETNEAPANGQEAGDFADTGITSHLGTGTDDQRPQASSRAEARPVARRVNPNDGRFIRAVVIGTAVAGVVAFSISFAALFEVAAWLGLPPFMHWAVPVFIDLAILVYAASVLVHESRGEPARASWWALGAFTALSVIANGAHAWSAQNESVWQSVVGVLIAAMVPIAVFVATDQLARVAVENPASRRAELASQATEEAEQMRAQAELDRQRAELEAELAASRRAIEQARREAEREAEVAEARHRQELERLEAEAAAQQQALEAPVADQAHPAPETVTGPSVERAGAGLHLVASMSDAGKAGPGGGAKASTKEVVAWIIAQAEQGQAPAAEDIAERFGCSDRTGRRRPADAKDARPELFETEAQA